LHEINVGDIQRGNEEWTIGRHGIILETRGQSKKAKKQKTNPPLYWPQAPKVLKSFYYLQNSQLV